MKSSHTIRDKIFKDHQFYQSKQQPKLVSTQQYQKFQHQKPIHDYQSIKKSQYIDHKYSSSWNPLHKQYQRIDRPYKELYQRKHVVKGYSDIKSDPFSVHPSMNKQKKAYQLHKHTTYQPSINYKVQHQRKYILPKDRQISKPNKHYHSQLGISQQKLPVENRKQKQKHLRNNSSLMKLSLDYSLDRYEQLNRSVEGITGYY